MLQILLNNKIKISIITVLVIALALIRFYETSLFYDPFLSYFKEEYHNLPLPVTDYIDLFFGLCFRYFLNTLVSLLIIYTVFKDREAIRFAAFLYLVFFILLITVFFVVLFYFGETSKMTLFYVRRFLIQPLFLLLFLPAFYYQKENSN